MSILRVLHDIMWSKWLVLLLAFTGAFLTVCLRAVQFRLLPKAIFRLFRRHGERDTHQGMTPFQSLCTSLGATVGTGNLAGTAGAICIGGPGAVFWMWLYAAFGMVIKYSEAVLALKYQNRVCNDPVGGPMYVIIRGLGLRFRNLARAYAVIGILAAFLIGNLVQVNAISASIKGTAAFLGSTIPLFGYVLIGLGISAVVCFVFCGGSKRVGGILESVVPLAASVYVVLCLIVLVRFRMHIPQAIHAIFVGSFSPKAVTGGAVGSAFLTVRVGFSRSILSNEAGMGTSSIAHASAVAEHPCVQGMTGILEVFIDTIVICTLTALVILCCGVRVPYGLDTGAGLVTDTFLQVFGRSGGILVSACLSCFAIATVLGWGLYLRVFWLFLFGRSPGNILALLYAGVAFAGLFVRTDFVWLVSETLNGFLVLPNIFTLLLLSGTVRTATKEFYSGGYSARGGNYANFHQCQPL